MFATPETQLFKNQYDILFVDTQDNPYLKSASRESKNKALKTSDKRIIKAINEIKAKADSVEASTNSFIAFTNNIIGDHAGDADLHNNFVNTGYQNLTEAVIGINSKVKDITKEIVFLIPKINSSTVSPEIAVPFDCTIKKVLARYSTDDNVVSNITSDIVIALQHTDNADTTAFSTFKTITITPGNSIQVDNVDDYAFTNGFMKAKVVSCPVGLKNLNVVVTFVKDFN